MKANKKLRIGVIAVSIAAVTAVTVVTAAIYDVRRLNDNPWEHTLLAADDNGHINAQGGSLSIDGDVCSNGNVSLNDDKITVSGYVAANKTIISNSDDVYFGSKYDNSEKITVPNVWNNVYTIAQSIEADKNESKSFTDNFLTLDGAVISGDSLNINVSADNAPISETTKDKTGKVGAFGAGFFTKVYENKAKWEEIFPILFQNSEFETDSVLELGNNSNFIPVQEQVVSNSWQDYEQLPGSVISDNFSEERLKEYISMLKQDNPVFSACSSDFVKIQANGSINPEEAEKERKLVIEGGHITLNGDYENLEEIKLDNWGGVQLMGNFPKLKYIYRTGNSDMNLAGDFPALECVYTMGGQILLGTGDVGFNADNLTVIDEYGPIVVYTAKDVNLTSSRLVTTQMILMRGAGADKIASRFNVENTLMAAINGVMFEDMNDNNTTRYGDLPVFYSTYPMSIINCNFKLLQGTFVINKNSIIMANANIDVFRGFMFSPEGVDEYRNSSAVGFYVNTYAYNISPNINSLNKQPNGTEEIGRISDFEYSDFPKELVSCIGDAENFLSGLENQDNDFVLGEMNGKPGELLIGRYILADEDIVISADTLKNRKNAFSVIASESGNITLNVKNEMDVQTIIYAPNGKVTLNVSTGTLHGRIFAKNIEIVSDSFEITGGTEDISYLGFVYIKDSDSESTSDDTSLKDSKTDSSKTDSSSVDSEDSSVNSDLDDNSTSQGDSSGYDTSSSDSSSGNSSSLELSGSSSGDDSSLSGSDKFNEPQYEYDRLNRLIKVTYDEENYVEYMYDANGNITQIVTVIDGEEK